MTRFRGVFLPVITPFYQGEVDYESYVTLLTHYKDKGISGVIPLGTTGESPCVSPDEYHRIITTTLEVIQDEIPVFAGIGGNYTDQVIQKIGKIEATGIAGILSVCPYYNRPDQNGLLGHFQRISEATDLGIIIYNIPYRTGVNMSNDTLLELAGLDNIVGVKDSCGDIKQSLELIDRKPEGFSILTGEDHLFYTTIVNGGDGGILASAHLYTENYIDIFKRVERNDHQDALGVWQKIKPILPWLFQEPNPAPLKYCLAALGLIRAPEVRAPLADISTDLKKMLDAVVENDKNSMIGPC